MSSSQSYENSQNTMLAPRIKHRSGFHLSQSQSVAVPSALKHEILIIPSTNTPSWGSMFICDIREKNIKLHNITLQFNVSAISGLTGTATSYPNYNPAFCWFNRIEILQNSNVIDTIYPEEQFILNQFSQIDEDRLYINNGAGNYSSIVQRNTLATSVNNYYVNLKTYFDQCHMPLLSNSSDVQLRIYMDTAVNQINQSTLTGTPVSTINSCNVICKITRMDQATATNTLATVSKTPIHHLYHDLRYGAFTVLNSAASTSLTSQIVLTPIVGKVAMLWFVVRPTASVSQAGQLKFTPITSFSLLDGGGSNIVGGQDIQSSLALHYLNLYWCQSSYTQETALGLTDNGANVYCWAFSSDPIRALSTGQLLGSKQFGGSEQLKIAFNSGTQTGNFSISVYALCESAIEQSAGYIKKLSL